MRISERPTFLVRPTWVRRMINQRNQSLTNKMSGVTAFIDSMREPFGNDHIDPHIRLGVRGDPVFYAREIGHQIGTSSPGGLNLVVGAAHTMGKGPIAIWRAIDRHILTG